MKKRANLILVVVMLLTGIPKTIFGQDTIIVGSFPSPESLKNLTEGLDIMTEALEEQLKTLHINNDSFMKQMKIFQEQMKDFHIEPIVIPDEITEGVWNDFARDMFATTVNLKGESKTKEVVISVEKEIPAMCLMINGEIQSGNVSVGIFDPDGKKQGSFTIAGVAGEKGEVVNGSINKNFKAPMTGKWKVKIDSDKAYGNIFITSMQKQ